MSGVERKTVAFIEADVDAAGTFAGYGSVFNVVDAVGEVVEPGAFANALPAFLNEGFVAFGHDWSQPVAYPLEASEDSRGLFLRAAFHSTSEGQRARVITAERLTAGKTMGLSIGYLVGRDRVDRRTGIRYLEEIDPLYEVSIVTVPANREAGVHAVKSPLEALSYAQEAETVLAEARSLSARTRQIQELRRKEGRVLSAANRQRLEGLLPALQQVIDDISDLLTTTGGDPQKAATNEWLRRIKAENEQQLKELERERRSTSLGILGDGWH